MAKKKLKVGDLVYINNTRYGSIRAMECDVNSITKSSFVYVHYGMFLILDTESLPPGYFSKTSMWLEALDLRNNTKIFLNTDDIMKYVENFPDP